MVCNDFPNLPLSGDDLGPVASAVLHRHLQHNFLTIARQDGFYLILDDGTRIFDASGGAAVSCIGYGNDRVIGAMVKQLASASYCCTLFFTSKVCEDLCRELVRSTHGQMRRAYIVSSGSEAMEAAMKLARQYYVESTPPEPGRIKFISRQQSYHGTTLGALSMGGHESRRAKFEPMLLNNIAKVSPCFAYRGKLENESDQDYVVRLAAELDGEFQRLGPETVCAFVAEPVVGAALGCATAIPGYFKAMKAVCDRYGALLIMDEVMSGMGRTGTLHAWEQEEVVPDIQTIGKGLGGGYQPVAGVLVGARVMDTLEKGSNAFVHGHTYQGHPVACAAALEVQRIVREEQLLDNVCHTGAVLGKMLHTALGDHPNVGDIRGRGLFWGLEFVQDKTSQRPFPDSDHVALSIAELGLKPKYAVFVYPGTGSDGGKAGDFIIVAPAFNVSVKDIEFIVSTLVNLVRDYFSQLCSQNGLSTEDS